MCSVYKPELMQVQEDRRKAKENQKAENMARLMKDMKVSQSLAAKTGKDSSSNLPATKTSKNSQKRTPAEILKDLEEQERLEDQEEYEKGYDEASDEEVVIDREDHDMYQDLRKEHLRRSGLPEGGTRKAAIKDDGMGGRWPAL